ncbi:AzlC family ABC transporter permease [Amphritea sp. 1_MG-2023]|uniref:AzlC family ABC transporter permease n=1 Tax=Amphritea sp. 1_MG-2023 TaxID=3062670 RepID=UPI0026E28934|nr:AzlC family ABC transporter permease [Amphritea sp. 1_MG-2023]MDO6561914.1 AzlC family ABC transporter permease [Amphritea sp. 1_MG-2023]
MKDYRKQFWLGVRDLLPLMSGVLPFGLITGATGVSLGMDPAMVVGMTALFFAGSAQLAAYSLIQDNAPFIIIVATTMVINLRFAIYSASFAPILGPLPKRYRFSLAYILSDQVYGLCSMPMEMAKNRSERIWYLAGVALALYVTWMISVILGIVLGAGIPAHWSLEFTIPLAFLAMLVTTITSRLLFMVAMISGCCAIAFQLLPFNSGFIVAVVAGVSGGLLLPSWLKMKGRSHE